ncbi:uncharacterized protein LOC122514341 [Polistes fuscatus]|uniref:uncharacterized protein LOC122514341 n=1 Tax=Polistes fuscatus TaxID=30207 RepID=UPI001CA84679|nr:uncharacterized protein LOC122514341 [Polistes fuscatus]KAI4483746.1 hypothetical protein M0804_008006 [Polistes exclamans]
MSSTVNSIITNRDRDCLACRIISGGGLIGAGLYVSYNSKKLQKTKGKAVMYTLASGLVLLGTTRILNLPPFRNQFTNHN